MSLVNQVELLARLYYTIKRAKTTFTAGRWTTKRRVLEKLQKEFKQPGTDILQILLDYGAVEEKLADPSSPSSNRGAQIRITLPFIPVILDLTFGYEPKNWDEELTTKLMYSSIAINFDWEGNNE